jgi:type VI protein secretion system component Hcp
MADSASPILLQMCLEMQRLDKAVLVKRGRVGSGALSAYLRMEFTKLLIRSVDWGGGTSNRETFRLHFAAVNVTYLKRQSDGTTASSWPAKWEA